MLNDEDVKKLYNQLIAKGKTKKDIEKLLDDIDKGRIEIFDCWFSEIYNEFIKREKS